MTAWLLLAAMLFLTVSTVRYFVMVYRWQGDPVEKSPSVPAVSSKQITRPVHPELVDVKPGDELLIVSFNKPVAKDPLHASLQDRINELNDPWDDDDEEDDGDGDVPAILNR